MQLSSPPPPSINNQINPASILIKLQNDPIVSEFLLQENKSVLDIGCELPVYLWDLYHDVGFERLIGFESLSENQVIKNVLAKGWNQEMVDLFRRVNPKTVWDMYHKYYVPTAYATTFDHRPAMTTEVEYHKRFKVNFQDDWDTYYSLKSPVDYLVLSNCIHLQILVGSQKIEERTKKFFAHAINQLRSGGLIFIRVPHQDHPNTNALKHIRFDEENFFELLGDGFNRIFFEVAPNDENTVQKGSIIYLGQKK